MSSEVLPAFMSLPNEWREEICNASTKLENSCKIYRCFLYDLRQHQGADSCCEDEAIPTVLHVPASASVRDVKGIVTANLSQCSKDSDEDEFYSIHFEDDELNDDDRNFSEYVEHYQKRNSLVASNPFVGCLWLYPSLIRPSNDAIRHQGSQSRGLRIRRRRGGKTRTTNDKRQTMSSEKVKRKLSSKKKMNKASQAFRDTYDELMKRKERANLARKERMQRSRKKIVTQAELDKKKQEDAERSATSAARIMKSSGITRSRSGARKQMPRSGSGTKNKN